MTHHRLIQVTCLKLIITAVCCIPALRMIAQQYSLTGRLDSAFVPQPSMHYLQEFTFDKPSDPAKWEKESSGLHISFGSTDKAYFRTEVPGVQLNEWKSTGWKGERLNAMILAWSPDTINQVRVILKDLKNEKGQVLSA